MTRQDIDPLADIAPPRHAYESDDEDEIEYTTTTRYEGEDEHDHEDDHEDTSEHHDAAGADGEHHPTSESRHRSLSNVKHPVEVDVVDVRIDDFDTVIDSPHSDDMIPYDPDASSPIPSPLTPSSPVTQDKALPLPGSSSTVTRAYGPGKYLGVTTTTRVRSGSLGAHGREQMPLIVASGRVGEIWARGAQLGEQVGRVVVEDAQVGLIFHPTWARVHVIISEVEIALSPKTSYAYAEAVLLHIRPSRVLFLDNYVSPSYISQKSIASHEAPLRVLWANSLHTSGTHARAAPTPSPTPTPEATINAIEKALAEAHAAPFDAPNLQTGTLAAFFSMLSLPRWSWNPNIKADPTKGKAVGTSGGNEDDEVGETGKALAVLVPSAVEDPTSFMPTLHSIVTAFTTTPAFRPSTQWSDARGGLSVKTSVQVHVTGVECTSKIGIGKKKSLERHDVGSMYL